ncbi:arginine--tRNA ligase [Paenibacillus sp. RC67]|uniref:arginine--tRNA ligase n=1 Tax=Paenibacillus sp. RC67 TaxID=3039392 RepID=UPI0024AE6F67|nr:arginine--tRNA ligase [Paenibacillus sp. RC67]
MLSQFMIGNLERSLKGLLEELGAAWNEGIKITLEQPAQLEHGDYSTNIAMQLAKVLRKPPMQIADLLIKRLEQDGSMERLVYKIEAASPGFINLFLDWKQWAVKSFAMPALKGEKVVIEHTSINPNKSAHIGHLRNSCIGDALVKLLRRVGYEVEVHNYIDDLGNQLADTVVGLQHTQLHKSHARFGDFCWDVYSQINKEYAKNPQLLEQRTHVLHALEEGDSNIAWIGLLVAERIAREHVEEMKQFGIEYDLLVWESSIVREGFWASAFELLKQTPLFYKETEGKLAGCWVLKQPMGTEDQESEHQIDKVLVRSNGILTYTAKDIAYHLWKFGLLDKSFLYKPFGDKLWTTHTTGKVEPFGQAGMVINVIDHRQQYPQAMVKQALEALGFNEQADKLRHVSYGVVSLSPNAAAELQIDTSDGKASYAMSGRQGIGIKISDLLSLMEEVIDNKRSDKEGLSSKDIAAAAIRYYLLRFNLQTEVVFDLQQATEISGNTGVYLLYSYARAVRVLDKAVQELGIAPTIPEQFPAMENQEYALIRHLSHWEETLYTASKELTPNIICNYAHEMATLFNHFYAVCAILKSGEESRQFRIWLVSRYKEVLGDALRVLGLPTPSRM